MTTVIYLHGTGTRDPEFTATFTHISHELTRRRGDLRVLQCNWGAAHGSKLLAGGRSIPTYDSTRAVESVSEETLDRALWAMLYQDPLYELRLLGADEPTAPDFVPGRHSQGEELRAQLAAWRPSEPLQGLLEDGGIADLFPPAYYAVLHTPSYNEMLRAAAPPFQQYRRAFARAVVAQAIADAERAERFARVAHDAWMRDETVVVFERELGASERGIVANMAKRLAGVALRYGLMNHIRRRRGAITDAVFPFAGDVLLYQGAGDAIRGFVRETVKQAARQDPSIVLLAHSLGGIICADLLIAEALPEVRTLITVGSQVPFLYELGALHGLRYQNTGASLSPLPEHFPDDWLNIYDLSDILSYVGAALFPGAVIDVGVDNRQPFPAAHGAYWYNPQVWNAILPRLP